MYASSNGETWEPCGEAEAHSWIRHVIDVDGAPIGLGSVRVAPGLTAAAAFRLDGEAWKPIPVDPKLHLDDVYLWRRDGDTTILSGTTGGDITAELTLASDGKVTQTRRVPAQEQVARRVDLGDGALIEVRTSASTAVGTHLWASRDADETWDPTAIPARWGASTT